MVKLIFSIIFLLIFINKSFSDNNVNYIAHAGGEIDGYTYTNSVQAIKQSIKFGYNFIEIDLYLSSDGYFYGFHDFKSLILKDQNDHKFIYNFQKKFFSKTVKKKDLILLNKKLKDPMILEEELIEIFRSNANLNLVTDKTHDFRQLKDKFNFMNDRLYIEISSKKNYLKSLLYSLDNKIFLTGNFDFKDRLFIRLFRIKNVVFQKDLLKMEVVKNRLKKYKNLFNIKFFTYTVNIKDDFNFYPQFVDFIYTDNILLKHKE
jgi:glycerophosphoryl diester phosphodiesterase